MNIYGMDMEGKLIIETVDELYDWNSQSIGCLVFDKSTNTYWICGNAFDTGINGWIPTGLTSKVVCNYMMNWDTLVICDDPRKISSYNIPCLFGSDVSNVQDSISIIVDKLQLLKSGHFDSGSITNLHLNSSVNSDTIPIVNSKSYFPDDIKYIEDALNFLVHLDSDDIILSPAPTFGEKLNLSSTTIHAALIDLEDILSSLNGNGITVQYIDFEDPISIQYALDLVTTRISELSFSDLCGTPDSYGITGQVLLSNLDGIVWKTLTSTDIICKYPNVVENNIQYAIADLNGRLNLLENEILYLGFDAVDITYNSNSKFYTISDCLDFLFAKYDKMNLHTHSELYFTQDQSELLFSKDGHSHDCQIIEYSPWSVFRSSSMTISTSVVDVISVIINPKIMMNTNITTSLSIFNLVEEPTHITLYLYHECSIIYQNDFFLDETDNNKVVVFYTETEVSAVNQTYTLKMKCDVGSIKIKNINIIVTPTQHI